jgi:hypothetical protein
MALYVAVCLLAGLVVVPESAADDGHLLELVWGLTVGLALAHWFAFRLSTRLVGEGRIGSSDAELAGAQLGGAAVVAVVVTVAIVVAPPSAELLAAELVLAGFLGLTGFAVARGGGAGRLPAILYAVAVVVVAAAVAVVKNVLAGH